MNHAPAAPRRQAASLATDLDDPGPNRPAYLWSLAAVQKKGRPLKPPSLLVDPRRRPEESVPADRDRRVEIFDVGVGNRPLEIQDEGDVDRVVDDLALDVLEDLLAALGVLHQYRLLVDHPVHRRIGV